MSCYPNFSVRPNGKIGFVIFAEWPKGHVEQLVGVFDSTMDAENWVARHSAEFIAQLGPPSKRVIKLSDYQSR